MDYTSTCISQNTPKGTLRFVYFIVCKLTLKGKKKAINKYWPSVNDIHAEIFGGKGTDVCNLLWNTTKKLDGLMDRWIDG